MNFKKFIIKGSNPCINFNTKLCLVQILVFLKVSDYFI